MGPDRRLSRAAEPGRRAALVAWTADVSARAEAADIVAAAAASLARAAGLPEDDPSAPALIRRWSTGADGCEPPTDLLVDVADLGVVHEATHDGANRRRHGVHYTPPSVAHGLAAIALEGADDATTVCDPAVGAGAFLLAVAELLRRGGAAVDDVLGRLSGIDIDPLAVAVTEASLALWGAEGGRWPRGSPRLVVADTLAAVVDPTPHGHPLGEPVDVVIGNPPFQSQLAAATARDAAASAELRRRWGVEAGALCDTAGWFLLAALALAADGGRIVLVLPQSLLASADAAPIRERLAERATLTGLWSGDRGVFDADVRVCAPVLRVASAPDARAPSGAVRWWSGPDVVAGGAVPAPSAPGRWSELLARGAGVPTVDVAEAVPLGSWCAATAGFRDQFYGLAPHTTELTLPADDLVGEARAGGRPEPSTERRPLVTVGMIEPLRCRWGSGTVYRYAGRRWTAPVVDLIGLAADAPSLAGWVGDRLHPKVLVATQTRVVEAVVDVEGRWIPSTPTIAVAPPPDRLWHLAAALTSPVATAAALATAAGSALSADTIKLSARQVLGLPTPCDVDAWNEGARLAEAVSCGSVDRTDGLAELGRIMIAAAGPVTADPEALFAWWWSRVPRS